MTLILTLRTDKTVIQVSDRRLTLSDGRLVDDEAHKAICVYSRGGRFSLAYTGLAKIDGKRTDLWLCDLLRQINVQRLDLPTAMNGIRQGIFAGLARSIYEKQHRALTVICAGYEYHPNTNPESQRRLNKRFIWPICVPDDYGKTVYFDKEQLLLAHGQVSALTAPLLRRMKNLGKKKFFVNRSEGLIANELVSLIRAATATPKAGYAIGKSCMSVTMTATKGKFGVGYHPRGVVVEHYMPHIFMYNGVSMQDIHYGPRQPPDEHHER